MAVGLLCAVNNCCIVICPVDTRSDASYASNDSPTIFIVMVVVVVR